MKRIVVYIPATLATILFVSCSVKETHEAMDGLKTMSSVVASIDEDPHSRAHLEFYEWVKWDPDDVIGVFSDTDTPVSFRTDGGNVFVSIDGQSVSGHEFYAFFPYGSETFDADNRKVLHFNNSSPLLGATPDLSSLPMVAKSDGPSFAFKQTCGILHFSISGTQLLKSVMLETGGNESVFGDVTVDLDEDTPVLKCEDGSPRSRVVLDVPVRLSTSGYYHVWFYLPPTTLSHGFSLTFEYEGGTVTKSTDKPVVLSRAAIKEYSIVDLGQIIEVDAEREALIALYNAMDGPNWLNNTNWCSDKPLSEWYGVYTAWGTGYVTGLYLDNNGLNGELPNELSNLKYLQTLTFKESNGHITHLDPVFDLPQLEHLEFGFGDWTDYELVKDKMIAIPSEVAKLKNLKTLYVTGINADLPEELFEMESLENLALLQFCTSRPLQTGFGKMKNLKTLSIGSILDEFVPGANTLCGEIPEDIFDLKQLEGLSIANTHIGGQLSPRIRELKNLNYLGLGGNKLSGPLPAELASLHLDENTLAGGSRILNTRIDLTNNDFSGKVPEAFRNWPEWHRSWGYIVSGNDLDFSEVMPMIIPFEATTLTGETVSSEQVSEHELTIMFQTASWCPFSPPVIAEMKEIYPMYKDQGLEVICYSAENRSTVQAFADSYGFTWPTVSTSYEDNWPMGFDMYPVNSIPCISIFDKTGQLVYFQEGAEGEWGSFVENYLGASSNMYESSDYSADGTVHTLQTATSGAGIDIVLMGDGYSDRLIADGRYASVMQRATEAFFSEEPYKSFRDCFNVYYVDVVSKNERYTAETALDTWYGTGTAVGGNDAKVVEYARNVIPEARMDEATVIVLMNRDYYAGTCYMYPPAGGDYGSGLSVSYFPVSSIEATFSGILKHEAGGHGFGKLADEYYYASYGAIPQSIIDDYRTTMPYGWWRNGDFTSDPAAVKWSAFLTDDRYSAEGLGVYEGAFTYCYGAWRPTRNSIMNDNTGGFNAPSRYAIWYRIGKLAYGADWNGTYEDFVAWDAINRTRAATSGRNAQQRNYVEKDFQPLAPPVVVNHSWRDF